MSVLYRKYRSKSLEEIVGQDHIVRALKNAIDKGTPAHAYLLTGPRGTGKTSIARIIAHEVNGIPYDESATQLDIIEIDAASNRRIDEIRELRDKVRIAPTTLRYKVYIIDEVHMLTKEAFNALLKTLEEPPTHAIFILATTELQKVPDTIISRTQRFAFRPITTEDIVKHLTWIAKQEHIDFDVDGLEAIASHANGGFRDAISILDQVRHSSDRITQDAVYESLGAPPSSLVSKLWEQLLATDGRAKSTLSELYERGYHAPQITKQLLSRATESAHIDIAKKLLAVGSLHDPKVELLLLILELTQTPKTPSRETPREEPKPVESHNPIVAPTPTTTPPETPTAPTPTVEQAETSKPEASVIDDELKTEKTSPHDNDAWQNILERIKQSGNSIYGPLRLAETSIEKEAVRIGLAFPFHIKRVNERDNLAKIREAIKEELGKDLEVIVEKITKSQPTKKSDSEPILTPKVSEKPLQEPTREPTPPADPDAEYMTDPLSIVKNVFGGAEVL